MHFDRYLSFDDVIITQSDDTATNFCTNSSCTNWCGINLLIKWKYKIIK